MLQRKTNRGGKEHRKVERNSQPPKNWYAGLRIEENKFELFRFVSYAIFRRSINESKLFAIKDDYMPF